MNIGNFCIWMSAKEAASYGATHHARIFGIIPGFFGVDDSIWIGRSDILNPIEGLLGFIWISMRRMRGEEPDFMFSLGPALS